MARIGIIGNPGGWSSEHLTATATRVAGEGVLIDPAHLSIELATGRVSARGEDLAAFDAVMLKKIGQGYRQEYSDRLEILRHLRGCGVPVFSNPERVLRVIDRLSCTITLAMAGVPMAPTVVTEDLDDAVAAVERLGRVVAKPLFTSKARGMVTLEPGLGLRSRLEAFQAQGNPVMYLQRWVELPGQDLGIVFMGGKYIATYARTGAEGSWNTTVHRGGKYEPYEPQPALIELARQAQALFGLDFTCVDVAETEVGPVVWEVSAFGGFRGLTEACKIDAAEHYVRYVLERIGAEVAS